MMTKIELSGLKKKYNDLKKKRKLDRSKYTEWTTEDVVDWIISLNTNKYIHYQQMLKTNLSKQKFDGQ